MDKRQTSATEERLIDQLLNGRLACYLLSPFIWVLVRLAAIYLRDRLISSKALLLEDGYRGCIQNRIYSLFNCG